MTSRNWIWTLFDISPKPQDEYSDWQRFIEETIPQSDDAITYCIGQLERCPDSGRLHLQLYIEYRISTRFSRFIKRLELGNGCGHAEGRRGTAEEAIRYCSKDATRVSGPWTYGTPNPGQGRPSRLSERHGCAIQLSVAGAQSICEECVAEYCNKTKQRICYVTVA